MFELKPLTREGVTAALKKAVRYRLLNEPMQAESICRDVLAVEPDHQNATINLLLSLSDQFGDGIAQRFEEACAVAASLQSEYARAYYLGLLCERRGKAHFAQKNPGSGHIAYDWLRKAMDHFEQAERLREEGNDDALLRWNTCARFIMKHGSVEPAIEEDHPPMMLE